MIPQQQMMAPMAQPMQQMMAPMAQPMQQMEQPMMSMGQQPLEQSGGSKFIYKRFLKKL
jgi:hypothetical protein